VVLRVPLAESEAKNENVTVCVGLVHWVQIGFCIPSSELRFRFSIKPASAYTRLICQFSTALEIPNPLPTAKASAVFLFLVNLKMLFIYLFHFSLSEDHCQGDKSMFCRMEVLSRYCSIAGYNKLCCKSCSMYSNITEDDNVTDSNVNKNNVIEEELLTTLSPPMGASTTQSATTSPPLVSKTRAPPSNATEEHPEINAVDVPYKIDGLDNEVSQHNIITQRRIPYERTRNRRIQELIAEKRKKETLRKIN